MSELSEYFNILYLLVLYTIQGLPMGISYSVPFILQGKITYSEQSMFGMVVLPFSIKLLWAPLVDSVYIEKFGRRKTWIVPTQITCGILMIMGSHFFLPKWLCEGIYSTLKPNVRLLTLYFSILYFLMATQDIAVDAWAINLLSHKNKGLASTCNIIGQSFGYITSYLCFLFLNDIGICNKYVRPLLGLDINTNKPICEMSQFIYFWGVVILIVTLITTMIKKEENISTSDALYKKEDDIHDNGDEEIELSILQAYSLLYKIIKLKPVISLIMLLSIINLPFAITESAINFKLMEYGMKKSDIMLIGPILIPFSILTPFFMTQLIRKSKSPLKFMKYLLPLRVTLSLIVCLFLICSRIIYEPWNIHNNKETHNIDTPYLFYCIYLIISIISSIISDTQSLIFMTLFNVVSDVRFAGTYLTLFNTISNLGYKWPSSLSIWLLDYTNIQYCVNDQFNYNNVWGYYLLLIGNKCIIDSFFIQFLFSFAIGIFSVTFIFPFLIKKIDSYDLSEWIVKYLFNNNSNIELKTNQYRSKNKND
ncbi:hypothetical protein FG386_003092 [Cryptosporidium ryanae]|uniref:uncharacterized protein n=1 Tax=Cryptosporidium ryanae TaxID=515981 RepID=UPI00351A8DA5|nr:hypothetical protein FG386_003092 [Cryptosporidium ryanae]